MSNIYIQEPPTSGKVLLVTSVGDIDVELWAKETPKACRNFIQLCLEGYYDDTIFHRLVPGFIVQGGDPTGSGEGGESVYGKTFKDEFHSRLRFNRRGLLGMANAGANDNASQFFFTLGEAPELNNKHTLFGKITGDTLFNMLKMADLETDANERPIFPPKVLKTKVLNNPFTDIEPRDLPKRQKAEKTEKKKVSQSKATKDFKLLSFGEEAEEDEEEVDNVSSKMKGKGKSSHDLANDPKLSSEPAITEEDLAREQESRDHDSGDDVTMNDVTSSPSGKNGAMAEYEKLPTKLEQLREEQEKLKRDLKKMRDKKEKKQEKEAVEDEAVDEPVSAAISEYKEDLAKYLHVKRNKQPKGTDRERETMALLERFKKKIETTGDEVDEEGTEDVPGDEDDDEDEDKDLVGTAWMTHKFVSSEESKNKVIDANIYDAERYAIYDPRNPINKRKLEKSKETMKEKKSRR